MPTPTKRARFQACPEAREPWKYGRERSLLPPVFPRRPRQETDESTSLSLEMSGTVLPGPRCIFQDSGHRSARRMPRVLQGKNRTGPNSRWLMRDSGVVGFLAPKGRQSVAQGVSPGLRASPQRPEPRRGDSRHNIWLSHWLSFCRPSGAGIKNGLLPFLAVPGLTPRATDRRPSGARKEATPRNPS